MSKPLRQMVEERRKWCSTRARDFSLYSVRRRIYLELADSLDSILAATEPGEWVSVKERLPDVAVDVLLATKVGVLIGSRQHNSKPDGTGLDYDYLYWVAPGPRYFSAAAATHWRPLPEPPKEE